MERFQQDAFIDVDDDAGPTGYWFRVAAGKLPYGGSLARMGLELSSIPAMSTEAERIFNGFTPSVLIPHPPPGTPAATTSRPWYPTA